MARCLGMAAIARASFFNLLPSSVVKSESSSSASSKSSDAVALDQLTGGAFTAPTTGERSARVREWLATSPSPEQMAEVFRELSHRDKGAAKPLKEKLDELKRAKIQEGLVVEWAIKGQGLLAQDRLNVADAMAWQRDAAKAGAPLSREPLAGLKAAMTDRVKAIEDLQHRIQVEREAAVLLAQRIEVMSTKPLADSQHVSQSLASDVAQWGAQAQKLAEDAQWNSIDLRYAPMLDNSRSQLTLVWQAFDAALQQAVAALADASAALPAVPVWADEIRKLRGEALPDKSLPAFSPEEVAQAKAHAAEKVGAAISHLATELEQGHGKTIPKLATELRHVLKEHARWVGGDLDGKAQALLAQAGDLEGWQRWRADQLRQELVAKAESLVAAPESQRPGGRKIQEALRTLREAWKQTDQGGQPNHALWKRFDEACNQAHKVVEQWLEKLKAESAAHRAQRLALIKELEDWTLQNASNTDWKAHARELHRFADAWRNGGHLGEKQFAELQTLWKDAMLKARAPLDAAQSTNLAQRHALIEQAVVLGAADVLRMDAVRSLQHEWQGLAQAVPLERKLEQKLWDAFRKPIDEAFQRKDAAREKQVAAMSEHDQRVLAAAQALQAANASQDVQQIQAAIQTLDAAMRGQAEAKQLADTAANVVQGEGTSAEAASVTTAADTPASSVVTVASVPRKVVAMRGDDRPGMKKAEPAPMVGRGQRPADSRGVRDAARPGAATGGFAARRDTGGGRDADQRYQDRGPRLGDAAFRAQRDALEHAQLTLKKLAVQAHGQSVTQLLEAWKKRDATLVPSVSELGGKASTTVRQSWVQALSSPSTGSAGEALLRLEIAAEVPTPASQMDARRLLQLQMLTRRNDPSPVQTWSKDVARVMASEWDDETSRRLQQVLKPLLRRT